MRQVGTNTKVSSKGKRIQLRKVVDLEKQTLAGKRFNVQKLADLLNEAYLQGGRAPSDRAKKSFAPSGIGYGSGRCPRRWHYDFTGGVVREENNDSVGIANMAYGTEAHERIQGLFEKSGILVEAEREVNTIGNDDGLPPIRGYVDLVINWQGEEAVGEIKTTSQESYVQKKSKSAGVGYHLLQVLIYMKVLGKNKGFLLYENKNTQNLLIVPVTWNVANTKLVDDAFNWMNDVYENWLADESKLEPAGVSTLPKRPARSENSILCKSCPFKTHCWKDEEGSVKLPTLEVPA